MARSKDMTYYPEDYFKVVDEVVLQGLEVEILIPDQKTGEKQRGQFYAFVGAGQNTIAQLEDLKRLQAEEVKRFGKSVANISPLLVKNAEIAEFAKKVLVTIRQDESGQWVMTYRKRDNSWQAQLLRSGTRKKVADAPGQAAAVEEITRGLMEKGLMQVEPGVGAEGTEPEKEVSPAVAAALKAYGKRQR